jgi:vesicular inhibitory amino acid transporter
LDRVLTLQHNVIEKCSPYFQVMRTGLGLGALTVAATVPFFAVVMSLIGSFLTLTVSVIFPSACYLKMFEDDISDGERAINWAIMLVGGFCLVGGAEYRLNPVLTHSLKPPGCNP